MLGKTAVTVRHSRAVSNQAVFVKYCPDFKVFSRIMKGISKLIFSVMSYMVGGLNNSRVSKNTFLESNYKAFDQPKIQDKICSNQIYFTKGFLYRTGNNNI